MTLVAWRDRSRRARFAARRRSFSSASTSSASFSRNNFTNIGCMSLASGAGAAAPGQRTQHATRDRVLAPLRLAKHRRARERRGGESGRRLKTEYGANFLNHDNLPDERAARWRTIPTPSRIAIRPGPARRTIA
jgi:hypothetical protein